MFYYSINTRNSLYKEVRIFGLSRFCHISLTDNRAF